MKRKVMYDEETLKLLEDWYFWRTNYCLRCDTGVEEVECTCVEDGRKLEQAEVRLLDHLAEYKW